MNKIIEITDLNFPELDVYARLTEAQLRTRMETERFHRRKPEGD